jgi:hypothetical protein
MEIGHVKLLAAVVAFLAAVCLVAAGAAHAAFPLQPEDDGLVDGRAASFGFGLDPGERRAKVVFLDDAARGAFNPRSATWAEDGWRGESPWSTDGRVEWNMRVFPGFYVWRLCSVGDDTEADVECDLQPELRRVRVGEGRLRPCRGEFAVGFFRHLAVHGTNCAVAGDVMRRWLKRVRFGRRQPPAEVRVGKWGCRLRLIQTEENPYGRLTCTRGARVVRNYGVS